METNLVSNLTRQLIAIEREEKGVREEATRLLASGRELLANAEVLKGLADNMRQALEKLTGKEPEERVYEIRLAGGNAVAATKGTRPRRGWATILREALHHTPDSTFDEVMRLVDPRRPDEVSEDEYRKRIRFALRDLLHGGDVEKDSSKGTPTYRLSKRGEALLKTPTATSEEVAAE